MSTPLEPGSSSITCPLIVVIVSVCFGSNFQFYANSVVSNLEGIGQRYLNRSFYFHYGIYVSESAMIDLWSFSSASLQLGCLFGAVCSRFLADRLGRRAGLITLSVATMIGSVLNGLSKMADCFELFICGRFLIGLALGGSLPLASMFITEVAPVRYRGACGSTQQLFIGLGNVLSYIFTLPQIGDNETGWPFAVSIPPFVGAATQFLVLLFYAYESPRYLVLAKGDLDTGLSALKFYQGKIGADAKLKAIQEEKVILEERNKEEFRFVDLFCKSESRRPLCLALLLVFSAQLSGAAAIFAYTEAMFQNAGLDSLTSKYASVGLGLCNCVSPLITMFIVERTGRKYTILGGLCSSSSALIALTVCLLGTNQFDWPGAAIAAMPCLYVYQLGFAFTNSIVMIAPAELFPQRVRASAMSVAFCFSWLLQCLVVMGYLPFSNWVGDTFSYVPFIVCVISSAVLLTIFMPETKGKTVEQVAALFGKRRVRDESSEGKNEIMFKF